MAPIVIGISGASGIILGYRAVEVLSALGYSLHVIVSRAAQFTAQQELEQPSLEARLSPEQKKRVTLWRNHDFSAPIASGSSTSQGMLVIPCSMATLAAIAAGFSDNLLRRAADVTLKERRRLVLVPREMPLTEVHLENMLRVTRMGGIIAPAMPGWYAKLKTLQDAEDFIVGRALDALGIDATLYMRWGRA